MQQRQSALQASLECFQIMFVSTSMFKNHLKMVKIVVHDTIFKSYNT